MEFFSSEKNNTLRVIKEASFVGLLTVVAGYISSFIIRPYFKVDLPEICKEWNKNHLMEASLFATGFLLHLLLEITGLNKSYAIYRAKI